MRRDDLVVRQWVADCIHERVTWTTLTAPVGLDRNELALAAALVEMMALKTGQPPPAWAMSAPAASETIYLIPKSMPRTLKAAEQNSPEPMRRRHIVAPDTYLTIA
jgi:hypothetical protein